MTSPDPARERQKVFRRMEWVFVYLPPILAVVVGLMGGFLLALIIPVPALSFYQRWLLLGSAMVVLPAAVYYARERWIHRRRRP